MRHLFVFVLLGLGVCNFCFSQTLEYTFCEGSVGQLSKLNPIFYTLSDTIKYFFYLPTHVFRDFLVATVYRFYSFNLQLD